jgi:uncharacterized cupredoxin-like copper-binding protein
MKTLLATATVSVLLLAACGTAGGTGATKVDATSTTTVAATSAATVNPNARIVNATLTDNKIVLDQATVPSGKITFLVSNAGTMTHEVVVLKTDIAADKIAPNPDEPGKMSEDGSQGESGDLDPTQKTTFTLDLTPGNYVLICNQPAHYLLGMHIAFTVK